MTKKIDWLYVKLGNMTMDQQKKVKWFIVLMMFFFIGVDLKHHKGHKSYGSAAKHPLESIFFFVIFIKLFGNVHRFKTRSGDNRRPPIVARFLYHSDLRFALKNANKLRGNPFGIREVYDIFSVCFTLFLNLIKQITYTLATRFAFGYLSFQLVWAVL
jgi:hypothetical protein